MDNIILVSGRKGVGKDTFCWFFSQNKQRTDSFALADLVKQMSFDFLKKSLKCDNIQIEDFFCSVGKEKYLNIPFVKKKINIRQFIQFFGTDFVKLFLSESYWVDTLFENLKKREKDDGVKNFIITDIRFPDEIKRFYELVDKDTNIYTIRIERYSDIRDTHLSETAFDNYDKGFWDFFVLNNKGIEELKFEYMRISQIIFKEAQF